MRDYRELLIWQRGHALTLKVYELTRSFPKEEQYGLTSQLRRAAMSVPANIAEGCGRNGDKEFSRFLTIALGSLAETEYFLLLAHDLTYISNEQAAEVAPSLETLRRMMITFTRKLKPLELS
ncbi:four helix bundle protein [Deinococcus ruber]|uniref:Four helix bundle protein n=1 Tax=Deinococcus ruber TaxID=1848197 RepID=A0A918CM28_9DEIO|nr:four helix bundle protein [Deinococcus ruber]GGR28518.1 four helix bundle protein [Deinococcus ruber]